MNKPDIQNFRDLLLALHKTLLDYERKVYEDEHGKVASPGVMLGLVMYHASFSWLRQISSVVVGLDELLESKESVEDQKYRDIVTYTKQLLVPNENGDDFAIKYFNAIKNNPSVSLAHSQVQEAMQILK